jgi:hypothetical protein
VPAAAANDHDPAAALSAFEETAAAVSRMLSKQQGSGNIRNLPSYLFRAFLRSQIRLDAGKAAFTFEKRMFSEHAVNHTWRMSRDIDEQG